MVPSLRYCLCSNPWRMRQKDTARATSAMEPLPLRGLTRAAHPAPSRGRDRRPAGGCARPHGALRRERRGHHRPARVACRSRPELRADPGQARGQPDPGSHGALTLRLPPPPIPALLRAFYFPFQIAEHLRDSRPDRCWLRTNQCRAFRKTDQVRSTICGRLRTACHKPDESTKGYWLPQTRPAIGLGSPTLDCGAGVSPAVW